MARRLDNKKLAASGGAAITFSLLAFLAAGIGMLLEPFGYMAHNVAWSVDIGVFSGKQWYTYFTAYNLHMIIFAASLLVMIFCFTAFRRRRLGAELGALVTVTSAMTLCYSIVLIVSGADRGILSQTWAILLVRNLNKNMRLFDETLAQLYYALPVISSLMLFITGIIIWARALMSKHTVETPKLVREGPSAEKNEAPEEAKPVESEASKPEPPIIAPAAPAAVNEGGHQPSAEKNEPAPLPEKPKAEPAPEPEPEPETKPEPESKPEEEPAPAAEPESKPEPAPEKAEAPKASQGQPKAKSNSQRPKSQGQRNGKNSRSRNNRKPNSGSASKQNKPNAPHK